MAKEKKGRSRPKRNTWLLTGGLVVLLAGGGVAYLLAQTGPAWGTLSDIGQGKPVIVEVFLPT